MANLPAHSRNYFTRANVPFGANNTLQLILESFSVWVLQAMLRDIISTGSTGGTRHANSIWICRGSSDGVTGGAVTSVGVAGTDRWGGATFPGAFIRGNNSTNHHWMLLENTTLGLELLLNMSQTSSYLCFSVGPSGTFSGGTVSACPAPSPTSASVQAGQTGYSSNDGGQTNVFGDTTNLGNTWYAHLTIADNGEFVFATSRVGLGGFPLFLGLWKTTGQQIGDNLNWFVLSGNGAASGRCSPSQSRLESPVFAASRTPDGSQKSGGGLVHFYCGGNMVAGRGVDSINATYNAIECRIIESAPQYTERGTLPDLFIIGDGPVGGSIPNGASQIRTVMGNLVVPFIGVVPSI